jgi:prolyl oligopeptidase PreP (S9A serine peptidase family)
VRHDRGSIDDPEAVASVELYRPLVALEDQQAYPPAPRSLACSFAISSIRVSRPLPRCSGKMAMAVT